MGDQGLQTSRNRAEGNQETLLVPTFLCGNAGWSAPAAPDITRRWSVDFAPNPQERGSRKGAVVEMMTDALEHTTETGALGKVLLP